MVNSSPPLLLLVMADDPADLRDEAGRFSRQYPLDAFETAVREATGTVTTRQVAETVGCSHELAYKRLTELVDDGTLTSESVGAARTWSIADGQ